MSPFIPRQRVNDQLVCKGCAAKTGGRISRFEAGLQRLASQEVKFAEVTSWGREFANQRAIIALLRDDDNGDRLMPLGAIVWDQSKEEVVSVVVLEYARRNGIARDLFAKMDQVVGKQLPDDGYRTTQGDKMVKALGRPRVPLKGRVQVGDAERVMQGMFWAFLNATEDDPDLKMLSRKTAMTEVFDLSCGCEVEQQDEGRGWRQRTSCGEHTEEQAISLAKQSSRRTADIPHRDPEREEGSGDRPRSLSGLESRARYLEGQVAEAQRRGLDASALIEELANVRYTIRDILTSRSPRRPAFAEKKTAGWRIVVPGVGMDRRVFNGEEEAKAEAARLGGTAVYEGFDERGLPMAASRRVVAHDSGDGETIYHCPFCGAGQVTARSDGTAECGFCQTAFTVQVQPIKPAVPQTIDGTPHVHPDMPGDPGVPEDPDEVADDAGESMELDPAEEEDTNPIFASRYFLTSEGVALDEEAYQRHLAIRFADDRDAVLPQVRTAASGMTHEKAYKKGWDASSRSRTYDLDAAESRFEGRYGSEFGDAFTAGWTDYAADYEFGTALTRILERNNA